MNFVIRKLVNFVHTRLMGWELVSITSCSCSIRNIQRTLLLTVWTPDPSPAFLGWQWQKAVVNKTDIKTALKTMFVFRSINKNKKYGLVITQLCTGFGKTKFTQYWDHESWAAVQQPYQSLKAMTGQNEPLSSLLWVFSATQVNCINLSIWSSQ